MCMSRPSQHQEPVSTLDLVHSSALTSKAQNGTPQALDLDGMLTSLAGEVESLLYIGDLWQNAGQDKKRY